jgi:hypothetical protein
MVGDDSNGAQAEAAAPFPTADDGTTDADRTPTFPVPSMSSSDCGRVTE